MIISDTGFLHVGTQREMIGASQYFEVRSMQVMVCNVSVSQPVVHQNLYIFFFWSDILVDFLLRHSVIYSSCIKMRRNNSF